MNQLFYSIIAIVFAVTVHEFSHAWVANRLGDPTARVLGRLTLNPLKHFDMYGTLIVPLVAYFFNLPIFGWAKPVPFNPANLKYPKRDSALVALAGPMANLLSAMIFIIPLKYLSGTPIQGTPIYMIMGFIVQISVVLFALNILPFPPFDGSKIIGLLIPKRFIPTYEAYLQTGTTYVIIFILFDYMVLRSAVGFSVLGAVISYITSWIIAIISLAT